jgi:hypothetical protein
LAEAQRVINRPKAKAERILTLRIERALIICIRAATIPRCSGFTTDQIGGIVGHAADASGDSQSPLLGASFAATSAGGAVGVVVVVRLDGIGVIAVISVGAVAMARDVQSALNESAFSTRLILSN